MVVWTVNQPRKPSHLETDDLPKAKTINKSLPKKIKDIRTKLKIGQADLAKQLSINSKLITQWEQGKGCPTPQQYAKLNRLFNKA